MDCDPRAGIGQIKSDVPSRLHCDLRTKNIRLNWLPSLPEPMHRRRSSIVPAIVFGGVAIGLAALGGEINLSGQNAALSVSPFLPGAATHETRADAQAAFQFSNANEIPSQIEAVPSAPATGLMIHATFDSSITANSNAAAIEAMINRAIAIYESLFADSLPIPIQIRFRYATTDVFGTPLPPGVLAQSNSVIYTVPWNTYINALRNDHHTTNDTTANASLPVSALSANLRPRSADGRAVGLNTPPAMFANGTVGNGGPYDGIITLNSAAPFQFTRPANGTHFDAQRTTEHEMDEVIGLGSRLGHVGNDLRPQDLFSWSSANHRSLSPSGTRYFSINAGVTNIVNFNQNPNGDFGDWLSTACPQARPFVQNAFSCLGQSSDVAATSPEGINLDVVGYDLAMFTTPATNVLNFSAILHGSVNPHGLPTTVHFQYGTTISYGHNTPSQSKAGTTYQNVSANISGLSSSTTYHFRIVATINGHTFYGSDRTFTTT